MPAQLMDGGAESLDAKDVERWRALSELRENPFLTPEWHSAWLSTHPKERPFLVLWWRDGELRGVLPLVSAHGTPVRRLQCAGAAHADWFTPACDRGDEVAMARDCAELFDRERISWRLLRLDRVDCDSDWPEALWEAHEGIAAARPRRTDVLPFIEFGEGGYEAYLAARSRNFRSQLGRRRRKLESEHGLTFRMTADAADLEADLETFFRLHEERWDDRGGSASAAEDVRQLHREFAARALERGWLRLWIAEADNAPAAAWYGWRLGGRYCYSLSGLGKRYEPLALGTVLLAHTIEQAAAEGASVYDLMWGDEGYKRRFETGRRQAATWVLGRRRSPVRLASAMRTAMERKVRSIRGR